MLRLSFIVPFYNVEPYIEECIRSLYAQDIPWEEYEVICVDDCSPDGSRAIVERLQKEYPTLKLLTTPENLRQGGARNMALDVAMGRYICFVDSDDMLASQYIGSILSLIEKEDLDIYDFDFKIDEGRNMMQKNIVEYSMGICTGTEYVFDSRSNWANKCCCVCAMVIRKGLIDEYNLRFEEKVQYEDTDFAIKMFAVARRVRHVSEQAYFYRYDFNSTTHAGTNKSNLIYRVKATRRLICLFNMITITQWQTAIRELIKNDIYDLLHVLRNTSLTNQLFFYWSRLGYIPAIKSFTGKRNLLALRSWVMLHILYKKNR